MTGLHRLRLIAAVAIGGFVAVGASAPAGARTLNGRPGTSTSADGVVARGSIQGVVVDSRGVPAGGAIVSAVGTTAAIAITDRIGRFRLDALPVGRYVLQARVLGQNPSPPRVVMVGARVDARARLRLSTKPLATSATAQPQPEYPILAAGFAPLPVDVGASGGDRTAARETAWRLRHLRRSVLKQRGQAAISGDEPTPSRLARLADPLADWASSLSGQVNLLTVGSFDSPAQVFSANGFSNGVAYLAIHSTTANGGTWTVRGAMTEGAFASWVLSGAYVASLGDRHHYEVGMVYGAARPDRGQASLGLDALNQVGQAGSRTIGNLHATDDWTVSRHVTLAYGANYIRYDYAGNRGLIDPHATLTVTPRRGWHLRAAAIRQSVAPGSEELRLPAEDDGVWMPPQYAFATLPAGGGPVPPERSQRYTVGIERDLGHSSTVGGGAFYQRVSNQFVTIFGLDAGDTAGFPSYFVADAGGVSASGWTVRVTHAITREVHGSVDYTVSTAQWTPGAADAALAEVAPSVVRRGSEHLQDVSTSLETDIPQTATHVLMLYRFDTGFAQAGADHPAFGYRFDVRVTQGLPFLNFSGTQWEALVAVRNFFNDTGPGGSSYDELLVVRPPKRIVGGLLLRF